MVSVVVELIYCSSFLNIFSLYKSDKAHWGLPCGPVAKTLHSQCRGPRFDPWSGNWIPHATTKTWCSLINKLIKRLPSKEKKSNKAHCTKLGYCRKSKVQNLIMQIKHMPINQRCSLSVYSPSPFSLHVFTLHKIRRVSCPPFSTYLYIFKYLHPHILQMWF